MEEGLSRTIKLPEDDPEVFEELLGYLYFGRTALDKYPPKGQSVKEFYKTSGWKTVVSLYILAERLNYEELQNAVVDKHLEFTKKIIVPVDFFKETVGRVPADCALLRLWCSELSYELANHGFWKDEGHPCSPREILGWVEGGGECVREVVRQLVDKKDLMKARQGDTCRWHVHERTSRCGDHQASTNSSVTW